jgi:hypothetical protein
VSLCNGSANLAATAIEREPVATAASPAIKEGQARQRWRKKTTALRPGLSSASALSPLGGTGTPMAVAPVMMPLAVRVDD